MAPPDPVETVITAHRAGVPIRWRERATWVLREVIHRADLDNDRALARKARAALARRSS